MILKGVKMMWKYPYNIFVLINYNGLFDADYDFLQPVGDVR